MINLQFNQQKMVEIPTKNIRINKKSKPQSLKSKKLTMLIKDVQFLKIV